MSFIALIPVASELNDDTGTCYCSMEMPLTVLPSVLYGCILFW